jgi:Hg(II)-responsive transcriptional regulator
VSGLTISELAKRAGVNRETIRYYERRRLFARPARTISGYRVFPDDAIDRLRFIKHAQALGFTLEEVRELLGLRLDERSSCEQVRARATRKLADVEAKIAALKRIRRVLGRLIHACETRRPTAPCPILESLAAPDGRGRKEEVR